LLCKKAFELIKAVLTIVGPLELGTFFVSVVSGVSKSEQAMWDMVLVIIDHANEGTDLFDCFW
jgi:hypothetical protein